MSVCVYVSICAYTRVKIAAMGRAALVACIGDNMSRNTEALAREHSSITPDGLASLLVIAIMHMKYRSHGSLTYPYHTWLASLVACSGDHWSENMDILAFKHWNNMFYWFSLLLAVAMMCLRIFKPSLVNMKCHTWLASLAAGSGDHWSENIDAFTCCRRKWNSNTRYEPCIFICIWLCMKVFTCSKCLM